MYKYDNSDFLTSQKNTNIIYFALELVQIILCNKSMFFSCYIEKHLEDALKAFPSKSNDAFTSLTQRLNSE